MLRRFGFLLAAVMIAATPALAQDERPVQLTIGGGWTGVYGAAADNIGNGGNFTIGVLGRISPMLSIGAEYGWNGMKKKNLQLPVYATPTGGTAVPSDFFLDANMQYGSFNAVVHPETSGKAKPYFIAGLGYYHRPVAITTPSVGFATVCDPYWYVCYPTAVAVDQIVGERSSNDFGMNFGGGVNVKMTDNTSIYLEVRYHYIWGPEVAGPVVNPLDSSSTSTKANGQFMPITVGFRF